MDDYQKGGKCPKVVGFIIYNDSKRMVANVQNRPEDTLKFNLWIPPGGSICLYPTSSQTLDRGPSAIGYLDAFVYAVQRVGQTGGTGADEMDDDGNTVLASMAPPPIRLQSTTPILRIGSTVLVEIRLSDDPSRPDCLIVTLNRGPVAGIPTGDNGRTCFVATLPSNNIPNNPGNLPMASLHEGVLSPNPIPKKWTFDVRYVPNSPWGHGRCLVKPLYFSY